jgi:hypothetical protein
MIQLTWPIQRQPKLVLKKFKNEMEGKKNEIEKKKDEKKG